MGIFDRKKKIAPTPVVAYSGPEQDEPPLPPPPASPLDELRAQVVKVLENQRTIVQNQQVILDAIETTRQQMLELAEPEPDAEPEPTPEELKAAAMELRKKKPGRK